MSDIIVIEEIFNDCDTVEQLDKEYDNIIASIEEDDENIELIQYFIQNTLPLMNKAYNKKLKELSFLENCEQ